MSVQSNGANRYVVQVSGAVADSLRRIVELSIRQGRGALVVRAYRKIIEKLEHIPKRAGEPLYELKVLRMQVRTILIRPLIIDYAVCESRPLVFIKSVRLLTRNA